MHRGGKRADDEEGRKDMLLAMFLIAGMVLAMVLIKYKLKHVDIVVDGADKMPTHDVPMLVTNKDKKSTKPTTRSLQQLHAEHELTTAMTMAIKKWADEQHTHAGTIVASLANRDQTRQYAVGNCALRKTVYMFLLDYDCSINSRLICASS